MREKGFALLAVILALAFTGLVVGIYSGRAIQRSASALEEWQRAEAKGFATRLLYEAETQILNAASRLRSTAQAQLQTGGAYYLNPAQVRASLQSQLQGACLSLQERGYEARVWLYTGSNPVCGRAPGAGETPPPPRLAEGLPAGEGQPPQTYAFPYTVVAEVRRSNRLISRGVLEGAIYLMAGLSSPRAFALSVHGNLPAEIAAKAVGPVYAAGRLEINTPAWLPNLTATQGCGAGLPNACLDPGPSANLKGSPYPQDRFPVSRLTPCLKEGCLQAAMGVDWTPGFLAYPQIRSPDYNLGEGNVVLGIAGNPPSSLLLTVGGTAYEVKRENDLYKLYRRGQEVASSSRPLVLRVNGRPTVSGVFPNIPLVLVAQNMDVGSLVPAEGRCSLVSQGGEILPPLCENLPAEPLVLVAEAEARIRPQSEVYASVIATRVVSNVRESSLLVGSLHLKEISAQNFPFSLVVHNPAYGGRLVESPTPGSVQVLVSAGTRPSPR